MVRIDYGNYLEHQLEWAASLARLALHADAEDARELSEIAARTHYRVKKVMAQQAEPV